MYIFKGEGLSGEVDNIVTYLVVTCDEKTSVAAAERVTNLKGLQATVTFSLNDGGGLML